MKKDLLFKDGVINRDPSLKDTDKSALNAIVQAAVNLELFTIPLYMTSLYSMQGTHQITSKGNNFYQGRLWPGMSTSANPTTDNQTAFNIIFSVFIAEMLHLQLASNVCTAVGVAPTYTSSALQNKTFGWTCYGDDVQVLPHILDFKDTKPEYQNTRVKLGPVNEEQTQLFIIIEQTEKMAKTMIREDMMHKYFPTVPFKDWKATDEEKDLPLFGSIGHMYLCLWDYLSIRYTDNTTLWDYVYQSSSVQQNVFNSTQNGYQPEYPGIDGVVHASDPVQAQLNVLNMIDAITDQGEGGGVVEMIKSRIDKDALQKAEQQLLAIKAAAPPSKAARPNPHLTAVLPKYQPSPEALNTDYPSYSDTGEKLPKSKDATARVAFGGMDHGECFDEVMKLVKKGGIVTWADWHAKGNAWTPDMLKTDGYDLNKHPLPTAEEISGALNRLKQDDKEGKNFTIFSQASAGAIAGVTRALNDYWNDKTGKIQFPFPSMGGSGDRMSICWAVFGKHPDLSVGIDERTHGLLNHSCQGLNLNNEAPGSADCAAVAVYHSCKGSNQCKTEGGCGFVQSASGGGNCSTKLYGTKLKDPMISNGTDLASEGNLCGQPQPQPTPTTTLISAPSDNNCATSGGCAVPISAAQMYPAPGTMGDTMALFDPNSSTPFGQMTYKEGDLVYDVAWDAYCQVLKHRDPNAPLPVKPAPNDLRLAFPPST
jgi:hypothetical protein